MAVTIGTPIAGSTTLSALLDLVYANRSSGLTSGAATFTPLDYNRIIVTWANVDEVCSITFDCRATGGANINYS